MKGSEIVSGRVRLVCPQVKGNRKKSKLIASRWEIKLLLPFREWIIVWLCNRLKKKACIPESAGFTPRDPVPSSKFHCFRESRLFTDVLLCLAALKHGDATFYALGADFSH